MKCQPVFEAIDLHKTFPGKHPTTVLRGVTLEARQGETLAIMGKSGEGKSTLLQILGTLDTASKGSLSFHGKSIKVHSLAQLRNEEVGFVFQSFHLLEEFTVLENILLPQRIGRKGNDKERAHALLKEVGLEGKEDQIAKTLSGGEKQRVSIARALVNSPSLLLADEPTGNLDEHHSREVQDLLLNKAKEFGAALIVVTHDFDFAQRCDRVLFLKEGQLYTQPQ